MCIQNNRALCTLYKVHFTAYTLHGVYMRNKPFIYFLVTL